MRDTIEMAREAGLAPPDGPFITWGASDKQLKAFEALVRADEREACAKVCEKHAEVYASLPKTLTTDTSWAACIDMRDAIRAIGEA